MEEGAKMGKADVGKEKKRKHEKRSHAGIPLCRLEKSLHLYLDANKPDG